MGNTLAPMQNQLSLADNDTARDAKETLDRLEDMAQDRIELFYDKIGYIHTLSTPTYCIGLIFCIFAVTLIGISTSSPSTRSSTSTPILVLR